MDDSSYDAAPQFIAYMIIASFDEQKKSRPIENRPAFRKKNYSFTILASGAFFLMLSMPLRQLFLVL